MWATCTSCTPSCEYAQSRQRRALCLSVSPERREGAHHERFGGLSVCLPVCLCVCVTCEENPATSCQQLQTMLRTSCFPSGGLIIAIRCFLLWKQLRHTEWSCLFPYQLAFLCRHFRWLLGLGFFFSISQSVFSLLSIIACRGAGHRGGHQDRHPR